jgi:hypothetical protein
MASKALARNLDRAERRRARLLGGSYLMEARLTLLSVPPGTSASENLAPVGSKVDRMEFVEISKI